MSKRSTGKPANGKNTHPTLNPENVDAKVAEAAYYLAEQRGFSPGAELDDWLAAEAQVRDRLAHD